MSASHNNIDDMKRSILAKIIDEIYTTESTFRETIKMFVEYLDAHDAEIKTKLNDETKYKRFLELKADYQKLIDGFLTPEELKVKVEKTEESVNSHITLITERILDENGLFNTVDIPAFRNAITVSGEFTSIAEDLRAKGLEHVKKEPPVITLASCIILPVQRPPRYILLLQELKKHVTSSDANKQIDEALKKIKVFTLEINEQQRKNDIVKVKINIGVQKKQLQGYKSKHKERNDKITEILGVLTELEKLDPNGKVSAEYLLTIAAKEKTIPDHMSFNPGKANKPTGVSEIVIALGAAYKELDKATIDKIEPEERLNAVKKSNLLKEDKTLSDKIDKILKTSLVADKISLLDGILPLEKLTATVLKEKKQPTIEERAEIVTIYLALIAMKAKCESLIIANSSESKAAQSLVELRTYSNKNNRFAQSTITNRREMAKTILTEMTSTPIGHIAENIISATTDKEKKEKFRTYFMLNTKIDYLNKKLSDIKSDPETQLTLGFDSRDFQKNTPQLVAILEPLAKLYEDQTKALLSEKDKADLSNIEDGIKLINQIKALRDIDIARLANSASKKAAALVGKIENENEIRTAIFYNNNINYIHNELEKSIAARESLIEKAKTHAIKLDADLPFHEQLRTAEASLASDKAALAEVKISLESANATIGSRIQSNNDQIAQLSNYTDGLVKFIEPLNTSPTASPSSSPSKTGGSSPTKSGSISPTKSRSSSPTRSTIDSSVTQTGLPDSNSAYLRLTLDKLNKKSDSLNAIFKFRADQISLLPSVKEQASWLKNSGTVDNTGLTTAVEKLTDADKKINDSLAEHANDYRRLLILIDAQLIEAVKFKKVDDITKLHGMRSDIIKRMASSITSWSREQYSSVPMWELTESKARLTPNFNSEIFSFNRFVQFIQLDIARKTSTDERALALDKWISIAELCEKNHDFRSVTAIKTALRSNLIFNLNHTIESLPQKSHEFMKSLIRANTFDSGNIKTISDGNTMFLPPVRETLGKTNDKIDVSESIISLSNSLIDFINTGNTDLTERRSILDKLLVLLDKNSEIYAKIDNADDEGLSDLLQLLIDKHEKNISQYHSDPTIGKLSSSQRSVASATRPDHTYGLDQFINASCADKNDQIKNQNEIDSRNAARLESNQHDGYKPSNTLTIIAYTVAKMHNPSSVIMNKTLRNYIENNFDEGKRKKIPSELIKKLNAYCIPSRNPNEDKHIRARFEKDLRESEFTKSLTERNNAGILKDILDENKCIAANTTILNLTLADLLLSDKYLPNHKKAFDAKTHDNIKNAINTLNKALTDKAGISKDILIKALDAIGVKLDDADLESVMKENKSLQETMEMMKLNDEKSRSEFLQQHRMQHDPFATARLEASEEARKVKPAPNNASASSKSKHQTSTVDLPGTSHLSSTASTRLSLAASNLDATTNNHTAGKATRQQPTPDKQVVDEAARQQELLDKMSNLLEVIIRDLRQELALPPEPKLSTMQLGLFSHCRTESAAVQPEQDYRPPRLVF